MEKDTNKIISKFFVAFGKLKKESVFYDILLSSKSINREADVLITLLFIYHEHSFNHFTLRKAIKTLRRKLVIAYE